MCGRFLFIAEDELLDILSEVEGRLAAADIPYAVVTGEVFPTSFAPILGTKDGERVASAAFWGFTNSMRRENDKRAREDRKPLKPKAVFNTRAETAGANGFWRDSFHKRRCLVPTSGFYEWQTQGDGTKTEYLFTLPAPLPVGPRPPGAKQLIPAGAPGGFW